jgi:uncharacterized protein
MLSDDVCTISWRARPRSFVSLMTLYESNFIRLGWLAPDLRQLRGSLTSEVAGEPALELAVVEQCRYTTALQMTYLFRDGGRAEREPGLEIRVYHDARLAEASACGRWIRHASLEHVRAGIPAQLGERWLRNMMLNKWLDYCMERGHEFTPAARFAAHAPA